MGKRDKIFSLAREKGKKEKKAEKKTRRDFFVLIEKKEKIGA